MALISCPKCGNQVSDKATACPHCGASFAPNTNYTNAAVNSAPPLQTPAYTAPAQQNAVKARSKAPVVICIIIAVVAVAALIIFLISSNSGGSPGGTVNNGGNVPSNVYTPNESKHQEYNVILAVECKENLIANKYDIDILIDDLYFDTLPHGTSKDYSLSLTEGSHKIEFRLNAISITGENLYNKNDPGSYQIKTIHVDKNETIGYHAEINMGNTLKVSNV